MTRTTLLSLMLFAGATAGTAQFALPGETFAQVGGALLPGVGVQAGVGATTLAIFTQEVAVYAHYRLGAQEDQLLLLGLGVGGSVRALRILAIFLDQTPGRFELDAGLRFGPTFAFSFVEQTAATRVRQFRLFGDLFVRGVLEVREGRLAFAELGTQDGTLRGGLIFAW